jgi:hypothetical protein
MLITPGNPKIGKKSNAMAKITDPALLQKLNAAPDYNDPAQRDAAIVDLYRDDGAPVGGAAPKAKRKVADPALLAKLNAPQEEGNLVEQFANSDFGKGASEGLTNRGIGVIQLIYDGLKASGAIEPQPEFEQAIQTAYAKEEAKGKGTGVMGAAGEIIADPVNWIGGGLSVLQKQAVKQVGARAMRAAALEGAGREGIKRAGRKAATRQLARESAKIGGKIGAVSAGTNVQPDDTLGTRAINTAIGAAGGAATGAALPIIGNKVADTARGAGNMASDIVAAGRGGMGRTPEELNSAISSLKDEGGRLANQMRELNVAVTPQGGQRLVANVKQALSKAGLDASLHPDTVAALRELEERAASTFKGDAMGNPGLDVVSLDNIRRKLGKAMGEDAGTAGLFRNAMEETLAQPGIVDGSPAALDIRDQFLNQWKKASRFQDVAELANKSNNDPNRIRTVVNAFTDKIENRDKFTNDEWEALQRSAERTAGDKMLGLAGSLGVDMGSISRNPRALMPWLMATSRSGVQGGTGYLLGGPAPVLVGTLANTLKNRTVNGRLEKALRLIEQRDVTPAPRPTPPAPPPLALPAPGYRAPMTDAQVAAARAKITEALPPSPPSGVPFDYGDVPYNYQAGGAAPTPGISAQPYKTPTPLADMVSSQLRKDREVSVAEAQKAIQDAAAAAARTNQLANSVPPTTLGDIVADVQQAGVDRAAAIGEPPPQVGGVGQALLEAITKPKPKPKGPLKITIRPDDAQDLPDVNLP